MIITNRSDIPLEMAVWLIYDNYDYVPDENYISATGLMKPIRHILLPSRIPAEQRLIPDVEDYVSRAMGNSFHAAIEHAWLRGHKRSLKLLGYPENVIDRVLINPAKEDLKEDSIPIYIEQRNKKEIGGFVVGGKFDMVCEGHLSDVKSTTVYTWLYDSKDEDYKIQGSIYRWLNPDKITEDYVRINFIFTDWKKLDAMRIPNYPQKRILYKDIQLMSIEETERWILAKLAQVKKYENTEEKALPECTDEELWLSDPKFKYYRDPIKATQPGSRSTKNFDTLLEANQFKAEKGEGVVITVPGKPRRCEYCQAFPICTQKDKYEHD